jgi:hypothetical protein
VIPADGVGVVEGRRSPDRERVAERQLRGEQTQRMIAMQFPATREVSVQVSNPAPDTNCRKGRAAD